MDKYRGHKMEVRNNTWVYCDTGKSVESTQNRNCGKCGQPRTKEGHDSCLGTLLYLMNACCGHSENRKASVQFSNGFCVHGIAAVVLINVLKSLSNLSDKGMM